MEFKNFKATLYDFFGYFSPGSLLIIIWYIAYKHSKGITNVYYIMKSYAEKLTVIEVFIFVLSGYILGHAVSSISSFIIEKIILKRIRLLNKNLCVKNFLDDDLYIEFSKKFNKIFNINFKESDFRLVICYVEAKQKLIYDTAFVFLSFYGMARNLTLIFISTFLLEIFNAVFYKINGLILFIIGYFIISLIFGYEYYRFFKYFKEEIVDGFLIPNAIEE